ncbi:sulfatase [Pontiella sulfatireligans]|uniref:Arylsulfatase n=1 Tax=Pontiella sulfatireligans TaxID=2750658 RepID=A0A6C2UW40_9BACT|nr:sulfatase [Pontiella sulfatireligans]SPS74568.1 sulfatase S1_16 [Kiritimatiellales bacterium]VGO23404.1 Arylsulfatase [Pontiella sulfatireligans]
MKRRSFLAATGATLLFNQPESEAIDNLRQQITTRGSGSSAFGNRKSPPPNFVFILIDDMGWGDVGFMGNTFIETPNIDRIAKEGMVFTDAYCNAPNCAPTRACIMTGQYMPRHGVYTVGESKRGDTRNKLIPIENTQRLPANSVTVAEALKSAGYTSACVGMWNLGRSREKESMPLARGFDYAIEPKKLGFQHQLPGSDSRNSGGPALNYFEGDDYLTDRLTDKGIEFMEKANNQPFFLYQAYHAVHRPYQPKPELVKKYERKKNNPRGDLVEYAATVEAVDQNVGRIFHALKKNGQLENTIIFFFSDNGGDLGQKKGTNAPLKGGKGQLFEGGIRVPLTIWGSTCVTPAQVCHVPVMSFDFYPTMLELAGAPLPKNHVLDGKSLVPLLTGKGTLKRDALYWHFPCYLGKTTPAGAIRQGDYKLIEYFEDGRLELFNLKDNIGETDNLVAEQPKIAAELHQRLQTWRKKINAPVPTEPNPDYDPSTEKKRRRKKSGL